MMGYRWRILLTLVFSLHAAPALGGGCPGGFVPASFPDSLPGLGKRVCPTSDNIGSGNRLIQQDFEINGIEMHDFFESYSQALVKSGWEEPEKAVMGRISSLKSRHNGMNLQLVLNDLSMMPLRVPPGASPVTRVKVVLQRKP